MIPKKVIAYLEKTGVRYAPIAHRTVYTAFDAAQTMKVKLNQVVKSLVVKVDREYYLVSLPADHNLDFGALKKALAKQGVKAKKIAFAKEKEITRVFKVAPGALTGFSPLHKARGIVDASIKKSKEILVSGGSSTDSIRMKVADYLKSLDGAILASIGKKRPAIKVVRTKVALRKRPTNAKSTHRKKKKRR